VSLAAITLCVASQRVFIVVSVYFVIDSVRKLLDTPSYEAGHSPPSMGDGENSWRYTSITPYVSMAWNLVKHRGNFTYLGHAKLLSVLTPF
jgi:hypothetical protein